ncbi:class III cytochrome C family protein [bacterium BMS3Bbin14]|nr:class III cytochrome C family protein [bacterium BMS3Abin13]GBE52054.1 class III cytochrome C family protein [bacterium BMS3Bbin14]HDK44478.1 cytochrome C [Desulfobacteraceae bacterium]HDL98067.1 cytochrome C [Desulfobacteraceae bacterium]HDO31487.1 cytochrome C [Desulfobacteraceae bacterium]
MKKKFAAAVLTSVGMLLFSGILVACAPHKVGNQAMMQKEKAPRTAAVEKPAAPTVTAIKVTAAKTKAVVKLKTVAKVAPVKHLTGAALYTRKPTPMTPVECARCHSTQYNNLVAHGFKHRFMCTNCHRQFHTYNPTKHNYKAIMPKCQRCHGLKHGKSFPKCMMCHQNPHSPLQIPFSVLTKKVKVKSGKMVIRCAICHKKEGTEFANNPTKHNTEVNCDGCHSDKHGYIPSCLDCHDPHVKGQTFKDCLVCHSPHSALKIKKYPENTPSNVCGSCHKTEYRHLQTNHTKHSELHCATCHVVHGFIPKCQSCHGLPHSAGLHKRFPNCLACHKDPHNLPMNKKK